MFDTIRWSLCMFYDLRWSFYCLVPSGISTYESCSEINFVHSWKRFVRNRNILVKKCSFKVLYNKHYYFQDDYSVLYIFMSLFWNMIYFVLKIFCMVWRTVNNTDLNFILLIYGQRITQFYVGFLLILYPVMNIFSFMDSE